MLKSSEIHKSILGVAITDGYIDTYGRFQFSSKYAEYRDYIASLFNQFPGHRTKVTTNDYYDTRYNVYTYKMMANYLAYFSKMRMRLYPNGVKELTPKTIKSINDICLAQMWMGDGYLQHQKNRSKDKIQNNGALCLESFDRQQLQYFCDYSKEVFNVEWYLKAVRWGKGFRPVTSGLDLQRLINIVYPHVIPTFYYKTQLYYKTLDYCDISLANAKHIFVQYNTLKDMKI